MSISDERGWDSNRNAKILFEELPFQLNPMNMKNSLLTVVEVHSLTSNRSIHTRHPEVTCSL